MSPTQYPQYMKDFFEKYYEKLLHEDEILVTLPDVEEEMWSEDANPTEEWKKWKLTPSAVTNQDLDDLQEEIGVSFPLSLRAFLSAYHHYFECPIGRNSISEPFEEIYNAWNPMLVKAGYLPFTWDKEGYFIRCIKLENMPDEERCGIYQIDHEIMFDFDEETISKKEIDENMEFLSDNLFTYLEEILNE